MPESMTAERLAEIRDQIAEDLNDSAQCLIRADKHRRELLAEVDRLHSWAGLLSLLGEHWPACAWPALDSIKDAQDPSRDTGARIVGLIRWVEQLSAERDRLTAELAEIRAALVSAEPKADETVYRAPYAVVPNVEIVRALSEHRDAMRANWGRCHAKHMLAEADRNQARADLAALRQRMLTLADQMDANHADGQLLDASEQDLVEILAGLPQQLRDIVPRNLDSELENQVSPAATYSRDLRQELTDWRQQLLDHPGTCATGDIAHCIAMLLAGGTVMPSTVEALRRERTRHHLLRQRVLDELPEVDPARSDTELVDLVNRVRSVVEDQTGPRTLRVHWGTDTLRTAEQQVRALAHALAGAYAGTVVRAAGGTDGSIRLGEAVITWSSLGCLADTAAAVLREQAWPDTAPSAVDGPAAQLDGEVTGDGG